MVSKLQDTRLCSACLLHAGVRGPGVLDLFMKLRVENVEKGICLSQEKAFPVTAAVQNVCLRNNQFQSLEVFK